MNGLEGLAYTERDPEMEMARNSNSLDDMSYAELSVMQVRIERLKVEKQNAERAALRERVLSMVKEAGLEIKDIFGRDAKGKGSIAIKYQDPENPENTWTGRGRMPRWMVAATKGGKVKKEAFLIG
jgi:DNA-binding protein H-NS